MLFRIHRDGGKGRETPEACWRRRLAAAAAIAMTAAYCPAAAFGKRVLAIEPLASTQTSETHAALALLPADHGAVASFGGRVRTARQLRRGSAPNPWERAWLVWNYIDNDHFYYLVLKSNGWELGKRDPAYPGGQRFLSTGGRQFPVGTWTSFAISQRDGLIRIKVEGVLIATFLDRIAPVYSGGQSGVYAEDARAEIEYVSVPVPEVFDAYPLQFVARDGATIGRWTFPFLGYGMAAIVPKRSVVVRE